MASRRFFIILLIAAVVVLGGCARTESDNRDKYSTLFPAQYPPKIGVVLSSPEKSEAGVNEAIVAGVKRAAEELDADYFVLSPGDMINDSESLRYLGDNNYDLIIAVGSGMQADLEQVAAEFPDLNFVIIDGEVDLPNVASIRFNMDEGAFLAGAAAASLTRTNMVGFIGGSSIADRQVETGFARGIQYINMTEGKTVRATVYYAGVTEEAAKNPARGKELANNLYWSGSDVVFAAAGNLGSGAASAAAENRKIALANDIRLMNTLPWNVYGVMVKNREKVVYDIIAKALAGNFTGGRNGYGLADGAVDFITGTAVEYGIAAKIAAIKEGLKKGSIQPYTIQVPEGLLVHVIQTPVDLNKQGTGQAAAPGGTSGR